MLASKKIKVNLGEKLCYFLGQKMGKKAKSSQIYQI